MEHQSHPSFGQILFIRSNSSGTSFYGSELSHRSYVTLEISESEVVRSHGDDRYYAKDNILRLRLSNTQFAELITSFGVGGGVPCTIERRNGERYELPEIESRKETHSREFKERMQEFSRKTSEDAKAILSASAKLSKKDQEEIKRALERITQEVSQNIPFFADQFQRHMDTVVHDAKSEVEAFVEHKIRSAGIDILSLNEGKE